MMKKSFLLFLFLAFNSLWSQTSKKLDVIAYYSGDQNTILKYNTKSLSHIIFSFCHLKDGKLAVDSARDSLTIKQLVGLKKEHPKLKVMLSLGGWGGCEPCSEVFSKKEARVLFAKSVQEINQYFGTDGLDLDWEYPSIEGHPGHLFQKADKDNFTDLVIELRKALGKQNELSFAAGGFEKYILESVDWKKIMPHLDRVNLMSYDLVNGYATVTGHHTPLFGFIPGEESTFKAVDMLLEIGVPAKKIVIGAAFYARVWQNVSAKNNGLYQPGEHTNGYNFAQYESELTSEKGWKYFWDNKAKAPYWYNAKEKKFATGDDKHSVAEKTKYAKKNGLGGIMFWELILDTPKNGLLDTIVKNLEMR